MTAPTPSAPALNSSAPTGAFPFPAGAPYAGTTQSASLYVGELHPELTESVLYELFSQLGPISSIRVCRDAITRKSLGYAYVNYHNLVDAERALETLNYTIIKGTPIRVMWSQRDPSLRRNGSGNIFIKNLDKSIDNKALHDTFSAFGNILSCKVCCDENGSRGFGFVHYETQEAANEAIDKVNGMLLNDKKVFVGPHISRKERLSKAEEARQKFTNVFVKNLEESVTEEEFLNTFKQFGEVTSHCLQRDEKGKNRGFGFVNFATLEASHKAVEAMNGKDFKGKILYVGRAQKKEEREEELRRQFQQMKLERITKFQGINLFVKNLDESIDEDKLKEEFSVFGQINSCKIMRDEKGNSKCFGFVCFTTQEEASKAVAEMNNKMLNGKPIYVGIAQRKEDRRAQLEQQFMQRAQMRMQAGAPMFAGAPVYFPPAPQMMARPRWMMPQAAPQMRPGMYQPVPVIPGSRPAARPQRGPRVPGNRPASPQNGPRKGYKFNYNARNTKDGLTAAELAAAPPEQQKRILGEKLFPLIEAKQPQLAGKITGMLLEMDNGELLHLLESPEALSSKISEALGVLQNHMPELVGQAA